MATTKPDPTTMCRGKWSVCGGKNPARSADWHICVECTKKRAAAMRAEKPAPTEATTKAKVAPSKPATMESEIAAMKKMRTRQKRETVQRVVATPAPEVTITKS